MNTPYDKARLCAACAKTRRKFQELYKLPENRFRLLVAEAVRMGIRCGDFHDYSTLDLESLWDTDEQTNLLRTNENLHHERH